MAGPAAALLAALGPFYGGGFVPAFLQLLTFYYLAGGAIHFLLPALLPVKGIQSAPRARGEALRDAIYSLGARTAATCRRRQPPCRPLLPPVAAATQSPPPSSPPAAAAHLPPPLRAQLSAEPQGRWPSRPASGRWWRGCTRAAGAGCTAGGWTRWAASPTACCASRCWTACTMPGSTGRTACCTGGRCTCMCTTSTTGAPRPAPRV
jgi:hypothetical protein